MTYRGHVEVPDIQAPRGDAVVVQLVRLKGRTVDVHGTNNLEASLPEAEGQPSAPAENVESDAPSHGADRG